MQNINNYCQSYYYKTLGTVKVHVHGVRVLMTVKNVALAFVTD